MVENGSDRSSPVDGAALPPHRGRVARLDILHTPLASHEVTSMVLDLPPLRSGAPATRLFLARPRANAPAGGFPVLYLLDGNAAFDFLTPALLNSVPGLALAGIGYDTDKQFARAHRIFDYSPPTAPGAPPRPDPHHPERMAGGAEAFLDRLTGEIRSAVETRLPCDPARRMLWGHSFGGLFTVFAATTRSTAFARYACISPSIWWDESLAHRLVDAARFDPVCPTRLYLGLGDSEKRTGSAGPPPDGPAPVTMALAQRLAAKPGLEMRVDVYPGAVHIASLPASLGPVLAMAAG